MNIQTVNLNLVNKLNELNHAMSNHLAILYLTFETTYLNESHPQEESLIITDQLDKMRDVLSQSKMAILQLKKSYVV
jgi:septation ring formation regulator EzrA